MPHEKSKILAGIYGKQKNDEIEKINIKITPDPYKNNREEFNSVGYCKLHPTKAPFVLVDYLKTVKNDTYIYQKKQGRLVSIYNFEKMLRKDKDHPNFEGYVISKDCDYLCSGVKLEFVYTLDHGNNFVLCYGNYDQVR